MIKNFLHALVHRFGSYHGEVWSTTKDGKTWIGYKCSTCGEVNMLHETIY